MDTCNEARFGCEAEGGYLTFCREYPDEGRIEWDCALDPVVPPWSQPAPTPTPAATPAPAPAKKASVWPWLVGGAAVIGVGYYLLR